jgi:hypothetical protein
MKEAIASTTGIDLTTNTLESDKIDTSFQRGVEDE